MRTSVTLFCLLAVANLAIAVQPGPKILHIGLIAPNTIGITVEAGKSVYGKQVPYKKQDGDEVDRSSHHRWLKRNGKVVGALVGEKEDILWTLDQVVGAELNTKLADIPQTWSVTSSEDPNFAKAVNPDKVFRKSKPSDLVRVGSWQWGAPVKHILYLQFPKSFKAREKYLLECPSLGLPRQSFIFDPAKLRSEAVHISHLGFRPDDPAKAAFLSCWLGSGGPAKYAAGLPFQVIDVKTGKSVYQGKTVLSKAGDDKTEDAYKQNYSGVDVYLMDFSAVKAPGKYVVSVAGIGCSYPFEIGDKTWEKAFKISTKGFYHQRSGIPLGPPYTEYKRPRTFHPDDGVKVYHSNVALMDTGNGLNSKESNFASLVKNGTTQIVKNAWGGYMDAGDWDRRIQHLDVSRLLLELVELNPEYFEKLDLNIPESKNKIPDAVDEALFSLDCYRRMQTPEGGIRGGIESAEHPRQGEASWQESLKIYAYAPGVWSSYVYAGVAARAAGVLAKYDPELAEEYKKSAIKAMEWAENKLPERKGKNDYHAVNDSRNLAAAELYKLTGEKKWNDLFLQTTVFKKPNMDVFVWKKHDQREAAWVYANIKRPGIDKKVQKYCLQATLKEADERVQAGKKNGFRWTKFAWRPGSWGAFSHPDGLSLSRAHQATGDDKYLKTLIMACQTGGGANPLNISYTTGTGAKSPKHPLQIDARITNQSVPAGLTVGGPIRTDSHKDYWAQKIVGRWCYPKVQKWPTLEAFWDVFWYPPMCEFTVHSPMSVNAYVWGYLAARKMKGKRD